MLPHDSLLTLNCILSWSSSLVLTMTSLDPTKVRILILCIEYDLFLIKMVILLENLGSEPN